MVKTRKGWIWIAIILSATWVLAVCFHAYFLWMDAGGRSAWPYVSWRNVATGDTVDDADIEKKIRAYGHDDDLTNRVRFFREHEKRFAWGRLAAVSLAPLAAFWLLIAGLAWMSQRSHTEAPKA